MAIALGLFGAIVAISAAVARLAFGLYGLQLALAVAALTVLQLYLLALHVAKRVVFPGWHAPEQGVQQDGFKMPVIGRAIEWYQGKTKDPKEFGLDYENVAFEQTDKFTDEKFTIAAWHVPAAAGAGNKGTVVVCVHGAGRDRRAFMRHFPLFIKAGYSVLAIDCREHGFSTNRGRGMGWTTRESQDAAAATRYARDTLGYKRVVLLGTSQGAAASIVAAAKHDTSVNAVIAENPYATLDLLLHDIVNSLLGKLSARLPLIAQLRALLVALVVAGVRKRIGFNKDRHPEPLEAVRSLNGRPVLIMHGTKDVIVRVHHGHKVFAAASEPKELWILENGEHTGLQNLDPKGWEERVLGFLAKHKL